jgi:general secretion pathway protein A
VLLIIDEAQNLPAQTLEEIRLLSNLETSTSKLLQILLFGQPELDAKLESRELRQLRQRIGVRWSLESLDAAETREYVRHRLRMASGGQAEIFSERGLVEVHRRSGGVPRLVNLICDRALLAGYAAGTRQVGAELVVKASREILGPKRRGRLQGVSRRSRLHDLWPGGRAVVAAVALMGLLIAGAFAWQRFAPHRAPAAGGPSAAVAPSAPSPPAATPPLPDPLQPRADAPRDTLSAAVGEPG